MRYTLEDAIGDGPEVRACVDCWAEECDCGAGWHTWRAAAGRVVAKHPARVDYVAARFVYPLDVEKLDRIRGALRTALTEVYRVDPDERVAVLGDDGRPVPVAGATIRTEETITELLARGAIEARPVVEWWVEPDPTIPPEFLAADS